MSAVLRPQAARFVPMRPEDIEAVRTAEERIYPFPWSLGNFADSLACGHSAWVCRDGGSDALLGYAILMIVIDEGHLLNLSIVPERQREGLGSALLTHLLGVARGYGALRMLLEVRPSNLAGRALYARYGFTEIGRRRNYYPAGGGREDAIVMALPL